MISSFEYTVPVFFILLIFAFYFVSTPKLYLRGNKAFFNLFLIDFITLICGIFANKINSDTSFSDFTFYIVNCFTTGMFICLVFSMLNFYAIYFGVYKRKSHKMLILCIILFFLSEIFVFTSPFTHFCFYRNQNGEFTRGKLYQLTYLVLDCFLLTCIYYVVRSIKKQSILKIINAILPMVIIWLGMFFTEHLKDYLLMIVFFSCAVIEILLAFENPALNIDSRTKIFTRLAFIQYINELYDKKKNYEIIAFIIENYPEKRMIYGGPQMDRGLEEIGKFIKKALKGYKSFYTRNGHFIIINDKVQRTEYIKNLIEARFNAPWEAESAQLYLTINFVTMRSDLKIDSAEDVIICMQTALNQVERLQDTNELVIDQKNFDALARRSKVRRALDAALKNNSILLYLQPIVDVKTRKIVSAEALARIYDEELGVILPDEFIPIAEKSGSIETLGELMLSKAFDFIENNKIEDYGIEWLNVNLSPIQCQNYKLPDIIYSIAKKYNVDSSKIHLEITEQSMIDSRVLFRQMSLLCSSGYKFSLDDFGTGFSNITRVKKLPFSNIKIDMSVVWEHFKDPDTFLPGMINLFIKRGLSVTAEGIETPQMADELEKMGCTYLQGYNFSKPIPCEEFLDFVKEFAGK